MFDDGWPKRSEKETSQHRKKDSVGARYLGGLGLRSDQMPIFQNNQVWRRRPSSASAWCLSPSPRPGPPASPGAVLLRRPPRRARAATGLRGLAPHAGLLAGMLCLNLLRRGRKKGFNMTSKDPKPGRPGGMLPEGRCGLPVCLVSFFGAGSVSWGEECISVKDDY